MLNAVNAKLQIEAPGRKPGDPVDFAGARFARGEPGVHQSYQASDVVRVVEAINSARHAADIVCLLVHDHDQAHAGDALQSLARRCIDAGADIFLVSGSHVSGPVEIYRERVICYGLGNFFFQYAAMRQIPAEVYEAYGLNGKKDQPRDAFRLMSERYFDKAPGYWRSAVPRFVFDRARLARVELHPISLGYQLPMELRGIPERAEAAAAEEILEHLASLSSPYGTEIRVKDRIGIISQ